MSKIRAKDTKPELMLRNILWRKGLRFRLFYDIPGKPDIVFPRLKVAVFCDGEFWHGKNIGQLKNELKRNRSFWIRKIGDNIKRDRMTNEKLAKMGWKVLRFWNKDIMKDSDKCAKIVIDCIKSKKPTPIKAVDFFCGAGGVTHGFLNAGIDVLFGIDSDESAKVTYENNNLRPNGSNVQFYQADIRNISPRELIETMGISKKTRDYKLLFAACPPCQIFSKVNTEKKKRYSDRHLLLDFWRIINYFRPDYIFAENVPGIQYKKYGGIATRFTKRLESIGYKAEVRIVDAKKYGIPQNRRRIIFLAGLGVEPGFPKESHGIGKYTTVRGTIGDRVLFPKLEAGQSHPKIPNHTASALSTLNLERIKRTPRNGGGRLSWSGISRLKLCCYKEHLGHTDVYGRMRWDIPSPALTTRFNSFSNGRFGHPEDHRAISLKEGAALQTFPDNYIFYGTQGQIARHIGNAVPVLLANIFGKHIIRLDQRGGASQ